MKKVLFVLLILVVIGGVVYAFLFTDMFKEVKERIIQPKFIYEDILNNSQSEVEVNRFTIYGKHLNLEGNLPKEENSDLSPEYVIVLRNNQEEFSYPVTINEEKFKLSENINAGINLEKVKVNDYIMMLKDKANNTYYTLTNKTDYHDNVYYTITNNGKNNKITFSELLFENINYWKMMVEEEKLPEDVYDIVIDPGHGGIDTGASNGKYHESSFTLDYAKALRDALVEEGLKVKLTREEDVKLEYYGEGSRTGIPYEVKAKLMFSVHLNSSNSSKQRGVEIYTAYNDNYDYAKIVAKNIVDEAKTEYSNNPMNKIMDGVYMRVYSPQEAESLRKDGEKNNYEPYILDNNTTYYYFIRESGGIMTKAFSDGRRPNYSANPYRNRNQAVEAYLCEIAYISQKDDLNLILNKKDDFIRGLKKSVLAYLDREEENENE